MKKRLLNKVLTILMVAAFIFSDNGIATLSASAAEKEILVEGVYTTFQKATLVSGTTKQIVTYTEPRNATDQKMFFESSNEKVARVSSSGLVTAVAPGAATITVTARDGSGQTETVKISVLNNLTITSKNVDKDNEIIIMDKTYGNVTIDDSVGNANIYLSGLKVKGTLTLQGSSDYTVHMLDSVVNDLVFAEPKDDAITSLAVTEEVSKVPTLIVEDNASIQNVNAKVNAVIKQEVNGVISNVNFTQDSNNNIIVNLEGFTGKLYVDASLAGNIIINTKGCNIPEVVVTGTSDAGSVQFANTGASKIEKVTVKDSAKVELAVPATEVNVDRNAKGAFVNVKESVGTITNEGSESTLDITSGSVDSIVASGARSNIYVEKGASVTTVDLKGSGSCISGNGEVTEAYINADGCSVDTLNTLVNVGEVIGALVQGNKLNAGQSATTVPPVIVIPPVPKDTSAGAVIVDNNFEDGKNNLIATMGSPTMTIMDDGTGSNKVLLVGNRTQNYHGVGIDFKDYLNKHITVRIKFDIMCTADGAYNATIKSNKGYDQAAKVTNGTANTWYTLEGTYSLDSSITSALLYIETPDTSSFYLDNVVITVDSVGDAVPVTGISLDKDTLTLDKGEAATLNATVSPANADNKSVTWSSSDTNVATVVNGVVTAVNAGTATITAKTVEGNLVDTCNVTVNDNIALSIDKSYLVLQSIGASSTLNASVGEGITWSTSDPSVATVNNGVITAIGLGKVTITASLGTKSASCSVLVVGNVVYYKDFSDNVNPFIEWPNNVSSGAMQNGGTLTAANGYLTVAADAGYKGPGYKFTNTVNKTYKIYARVKNAGSAANQQVQFIDQTSSSASLQSYTINNTNWTLIEYTAVIAANSNKIICLTPSYNNGTLTYYVDDFLIVDVTGGDQQGGGEQPGTLPNLNSFYIANNASFDSSGKVIYLDSTNYQNFAKSTNSDSALLNKFTTWSGIRDVVKGIEYTVTINQATAVSGSSIKTNVLIQNKKSETWGGSYKNFTEDTGVSSVSGSAITITKTILFDNVSWSASDTEAGKIQLTLSDIYTSSPVSGTVTFKVIPKESAVPYFTDFYAAQNKSFDLSVSSKDSNWSDVYLNKENFKGIASGSGISDTELLDKFTTWGGVKEVVKQYEISVTIDSGKALSDNLQANILVQNQKTNDGWNGSYKQYPVDATVSTVSGSSITLTKTIVLSNETWDASDNYLGKISLQFKNADASVPLKGTWSIKVVANNKN